MAAGRVWSWLRVVIGLGCLLMLAASPPVADLIREANVAFFNHDLDTADQLYARAEERSSDPGLIAFNRAGVLFERGEFLEAERHYLRSLDDRECPPDRAMRAWFNRGICLLRRGGDARVYRSAIASFERCLDLNPGDPQFRARVEYHLELAKVLWIQANQVAAKPTRPEDLPPEERGPESPPQPRTSGQDDPMGANDPGSKQNPNTTQQPIPQPGPLPIATQTPNATNTKVAGNNTLLPVVRGGADLDPTTPESARDILKQTDLRLRQRREQMNAILGGSVRSGVRDW